MSDHNFEKKIQQKMDELKLVPSAGVWISVEKNIKRDKRRRRAIFWLPLLFLLLGGSGYFLLTNNSSSKTDNTRITIPSDIKNKENKPVITAGVVKHSQETQVGKTTLHRGGDKQKVFVSVKHSSRGVAENYKTVENGSTNPVTTKEKKPIVKDNTSNEEPAVAATSKAGQPNAGDDLTKSASSETIPLDSSQQLTAKKETVDSVSKKTDAVVSSSKKPRQQTKTSSAWQFGLMGNIGISKNVKGGNPFQKSSAPNVYYSAPPPGASTGGSIYRPASPVNSGPTFSMGAFAEKSISKRVNISIGLKYTYMSTTTAIGNKVDSPRIVSSGNQIYSLVGTYYPNSNTHRYTNSYHFIEIPVSIDWKFNERKKLPFSWESGLQLMQMLGTNAVHYDASHGIYFKNSSYFNKTQLGIFTGLSFETFRNSKHPLWIGPRVDYLFTNLLKKSYGEDQHLFSAGISAKMLLKK